MKRSRKTLLVASGALVICLSLIAAASAFHKAGRGVLRQEMTDYMLYRLDKAAETLQLDAAQQAGFAKLKARLLAQMEQTRTSRDQAHEKMLAELNTAEPDLRAAADVVSGGMQTFQDSMNASMNELLSFYATLDATQRAAVVAMLKERLETDIE